MSGDSSLGIGIGLALKSYGRGLTYVKTDRALDLGNLAPFTIPDLSGNANTATLYSGIYVTTNGTTDKAIRANATALGSGNYYLTGKIKPAGTTAKTTMDGSTASNLTGLTAGVWQDFQTATASAITPSSINLGWDGTAFNATVDNWSDVKLHDASDDSVVARYKLYDSADASLGGYPALDCVGGFHGAHVGCAGGSGEPDILQTAGEDFNIGGGGADVVGDITETWEKFFGTGTVSAASSTSFTISAGSSGLAVDLSGGAARAFFSAGAGEFTAINLTITGDLSAGQIRTAEGAGNASPLQSVSIGAAGTKTILIGNTSGAYDNFYFISLASTGGATITINAVKVNSSLSPYWPSVDPFDENIFVAESETTAGQDALGTAIENPRPNDRVLNLTTGTGYAEVADSASLDLTTEATWEIWGNFYELFSSSETLLSKWSSSATAQRSWIVNGNNGAELNRVRLAISANGSSVSWIGYVEVPDSVSSLIFTYNGTIVAGYVNGSSVTVTTTFGSIPASMNVGTAPLFIGTDNDSGTMLLRQIGDIRIYDRVLTADEVLKNYQARKSAYGL
jgi:hypothetical protein